ncbi:MAG: anti-sigma factor [Candidatus Sulfotelmatobacter sp.]
MACEPWKEKLDTYLDGELPEKEMRDFDAHVRSCASCAADALRRVQMKRAIQAAGKRFVPSDDFRRQVQQSIASKPGRSFGSAWVFAAAFGLILVIGLLTSAYVRMHSGREQIYSEIADLHVATLASSSPVDVVSTDRHTVKPWFQGRIPFSFNLPELQNSEFSLLGGRVTYLDQTPGAHLIYDVRKHHISVFVFQERSVNSSTNLGDSSVSPKKLPFTMETWAQGGLRYFVVGDAGIADIGRLANLFKAAAS